MSKSVHVDVCNSSVHACTREFSKIETAWSYMVLWYKYKCQKYIYDVKFRAYE